MKMNETISPTDGARIRPSYSYRDIWKIVFPLLLSSIVEQLIGMTDTAFLGRVGEVELGASALGGIFFIAVFMLILGFCSGAQILMGRRNGENKPEDIGSVFWHSLLFLTLLSTILLIATQWFAPALLRLFISSDAVYEAAWTYLDWRMWGVYFSMVACLFRAFFVGTTQTGVLKYNSAVMVLANVVLNYALVFGHFGCPALGIAGAAIASSLSSGISMLFFIVYTFVKVDYRRFAFHRLPNFKLSLLGKMLNVSLWMMVQSFLSLITWFLFFIAIEHLGQRELAVTNVMRTIAGFTFMAVSAFASTASTLTSNFLGSGHLTCVRPMVWRVIRMAYFVLIPIWLLIVIFPVEVMSIFTDEAPIIEAGVAPIRVLALSYIFEVPAFVFFQAISGTGNTRISFYIEVFSLVVYCCFVYYAVYLQHCSLSVAWVSEILYALFLFIPGLLYMRFGRWYRKEL
jgi:MATE efflux family protein